MAEYLTIPELAELLGMSTESLYERARNGELPGAFQLGRLWRVNIEVFERETTETNGEEE